MTGRLQTFILKKSLREEGFIQKRLITSLLLSFASVIFVPCFYLTILIYLLN